MKEKKKKKGKVGRFITSRDSLITQFSINLRVGQDWYRTGTQLGGARRKKEAAANGSMFADRD